MDSHILYYISMVIVLVSLITLLVSTMLLVRPFISKKSTNTVRQIKGLLTIMLISIPILLLSTLIMELLGNRISFVSFIYGIIVYIVVFILCLPFAYARWLAMKSLKAERRKKGLRTPKFRKKWMN